MRVCGAMRLYAHQDIVEIFQIEIEKFGIERICLTPVWVEGMEPAVWAMSDARNLDQPIVELESPKMSIWVPERWLSELSEKVIVRGRRGFTIGAMTDSLRNQVTTFVQKSN